MKVCTKPRRRKARTPAWHAEFLRMLPRIHESASVAFRHLTPEARQEAVQDVTVGALIAFVRLIKLGKARLAFPTVLARYGIAQYRCGRRVGSRLNVRDVSSLFAQRKKKFVVERLDHFSAKDDVWREALVEDKRALHSASARLGERGSCMLSHLPRKTNPPPTSATMPYE